MSLNTAADEWKLQSAWALSLRENDTLTTNTDNTIHRECVQRAVRYNLVEKLPLYNCQQLNSKYSVDQHSDVWR